ncbi:Bifunctional epoxide hydrolase-like protein [Zalerion maritima]|uniref:Bifunctional epoxide hydrolase-like protein n=1 Tax=Zalerion maritima TaxID=339359 RepID=A0AAD5RS14_9PEZI|nr:Bifunctional epoxide hydrolase-like protein [Zalerion maritima]
MDTSKLVPNDSRVEWRSLTTRGHTYSYQVVAPPSSICAAPKDTIILIHGFPDLSFGWRNQAPYLAFLGYRVVIPDLLGYGRTDAPEDPAEYTLKKLSDDVAAIAAAVTGNSGQVILGGHDWGGALAWRVPLWHPELVKAVFVVCTPYSPPSNSTYLSLETFIEHGILTNFGYQLQFARGDVEAKLGDKNATTIRQFLRTMFGGTTPDGEPGFNTTKGILFDKYMEVRGSPLVSTAEMDYYVDEYMRHGMVGPLNWYRTREMNFEDEIPLADAGKTKIDAPALFIAASKDTALPPSMSEGMESNFTQPLQRGEVPTSHWALEQAPAQVNGYISGFLASLARESKL